MESGGRIEGREEGQGGWRMWREDRGEGGRTGRMESVEGG